VSNLNYCVYIHTNKLNSKKYIGISSDVKQRWKGNGSSYYDQVIGLAIKKYGWNNFDHDIIYSGLSKEEACDKEKELILKYNTRNKEFGYNRSDGGDCGSKGSYESQLKRIRKVYQYDIEGNYIKCFNSIPSAVRELAPHLKNSGNIPSCCKGTRPVAFGYRWFYDYMGEKIDSLKSKHERISENKSIKIYQYTLSGSFVREYKSISEAQRKFGTTSIRQCSSGICKTSHGYQWLKEYMGEKIPAILSTAQKSSIRNSKPLYIYDIDFKLVYKFNKCKDASKFLKTYNSKIKKYCDNNLLFDGKYYVSYEIKEHLRKAISKNDNTYKVICSEKDMIINL